LDVVEIYFVREGMMKIDNYHDLRVPSAAVHKGRVQHSDAGLPDVSTQKPSRRETGMRELGNALMVMQKAQMLVQEALSVSSRLQNIAAEGVNNGSIDYTQINNELAQVSTSFEELSPSMKSQVGPITDGLRKASDALGRGDMKAVDNALTHTAGLIDEQSTGYIRTMGADSLMASDAKISAAKGLPDTAIFVQGGVSSERVSRLIS